MLDTDAIKHVGVLVGVGAVVGLGQLLVSNEKLIGRIIVGRAIVSGGLALAAAGLLSFIPELSFYAQVGVASALSSLGTSALERVVQRITGTA
jgi:membrane protein implicated in regulation of membrane protease activity